MWRTPAGVPDRSVTPAGVKINSGILSGGVAPVGLNHRLPSCTPAGVNNWNWNPNMSATVTHQPAPSFKLERVDLVLLGSIALVALMSLVYVTSAAQDIGGGSGTSYGIKQAIYAGIGVLICIAMQQFHYMTILRYSPFLYAIAIALLIGVFFTRAIKGAHCWYDLYFFKFEPSEIAKPIIIVTLAHYLMYRDSYKTLKGLVAPFLLAMIPLALILKQPYLGGAMAFAPVIFVMLFAAGAKLRHLALTCAAGACGIAVMWFTIMHDYQQKRILAWLHPEQFQLGEAWQQLLSTIAIGSGGFWGKGWGQSNQNSLRLPEKHTDFIFAVVGEEGGFITAALLLVLVFIAALSGLGIAARTREPAGRLIAVGCVTVMCSQVLINVSVAMGLLPTTGLTLPFVSYGGSSMISSFIILGLLFNIGSKREVVLANEDFA
jgi:rod shape determining protein RodA